MALYIPEGETPFHPDILEKPELRISYQNFGNRKGDLAVAAQKGKEIIGLIWGRLHTATNPGYGFISEEYPEIGMAVKPGYRKRGIGRQLLMEIESCYLREGVRAISLSVDKRNPARNLYGRTGYETYAEKGTALTLVKYLES